MKRVAAWLLTLSLLPFTLHADERGIDEGIEYQLLSTPVSTSAPEGKVEVLEFFWYGCPHCYHFEPYLKAWLAEQGDKVRYVRKPSTINPSWTVHARAFYAAQALDVVDKIHQPLFDAIHKEKRKLFTEDELAAFFAEQGVDEQEFRKAFRSFYTDTNIRRDRLTSQQCCPSGVPAIVINGKYYTDATLAGGNFDRLTQVMSHLVEMERAK